MYNIYNNIYINESYKSKLRQALAKALFLIINKCAF